MSQAKKHHYVPRFILKNFSFGKRKKIHVYDKLNTKQFAASINDTGAENYFYDDADDYAISTEDKLAKLETETAPIIKRIVDAQSLRDITVLEYGTLALYITVQKMRTNNQRDFLFQMNQSLSQWCRKDGIDPNKDVENFMEITKKEANQAATQVLRSLPGELAPLVFEKVWILNKAPKGHNYLISDHPVVLHNNNPRKGRGNLGIGLEGIEIQFPISPKLSLTLFCPVLFQDMIDKVNNHKVLCTLTNQAPLDVSEIESLIHDANNRVSREVSPENVEFNNSLQVQQSSRFVYSVNNDFFIVEDMLKDFPELKSSPTINTHQYL